MAGESLFEVRLVRMDYCAGPLEPIKSYAFRRGLLGLKKEKYDNKMWAWPAPFRRSLAYSALRYAGIRPGLSVPKTKPIRVWWV